MRTITAIQIAREMKLPEKRVRAILRDRGFTKDGGRWVFAVSQKSEIKSVIRAARRIRPEFDRSGETVH